MHLNWRGKAAKIQWLFMEGSTALNQLKQVVYVCAALKIFGVPIVGLLALSPVIYLAHVGAGYLWVRHGFYKQTQEVAIVQTASPMAMLPLVMLFRLYQQMGLPVNGQLNQMPNELQEILASFAPTVSPSKGLS